MTLRIDIAALVRLHLTPEPTAELILGYLHSRGIMANDGWLDDDPEIADRLDFAAEVAEHAVRTGELPDLKDSN